MCKYPIYRYYYINSKGKIEIDWKSEVVYFDADNVVKLKCGKCDNCLFAHSNEWALRIMLESELYVDNCFVTLTYADNPISLVKRDIQLFIKRLRKFIYPKKIRIFYCGEYGAKGLRPHYHIILFNYKPTDLEPFFVEGGNQIYKSIKLQEIWSKGFVSVGLLDLKSARYCAKYMQKKQLSKLEGLVKPFIHMSKGIAKDRFNLDMYNTDKIYYLGKIYSIPRYFDKLAVKQGYDLTDKKEIRLRKSKMKFISNENIRKEIKKSMKDT